MPWYLYYPHKIDYLVTGMLQKSPRSGAYTTVYCATMDTRMKCNNRNDSYFVNSELQPVARCALNEEDAARLWKLSSNLVSWTEVSHITTDTDIWAGMSMEVCTIGMVTLQRFAAPQTSVIHTTWVQHRDRDTKINIILVRQRHRSRRLAWQTHTNDQ